MRSIPPLAPTLWRSCRVLANATRLRVLAEILETPGLSVTQLAHRAGVSQPQATQHLRLLQSRGLLRATRAGRFTCYRAHADASVVHADALLVATRAAIRRGVPAEEMVKAFTAFTHERRILLLRAIRSGCAERGELVVRTGVSPPALKRHLRKLARRGVVSLSRAGVHPARLPPGLLRSLAGLV